MAFADVCASLRFILLFLGIITLPYGIGILLIVLAIYGFVKNNELNKSKIFLPPEGFNYPLNVKTNSLEGCPACKSKQLEKIKNKFRCIQCGSWLAPRADEKYIFVADKSIEDKEQFSYNKFIFSIQEWNMIFHKNLTLREYAINQLSEGKISPVKEKEARYLSALQKNEWLARKAEASLHEPRAVRVGSNTSVRIAKGVRVPVTRARSEQQMSLLDTGTLLLTNKRLIFIGSNKTANIHLKKILDLNLYVDGFKINIDGRNKPRLYAVVDPDIWVATINGLEKMT